MVSNMSRSQQDSTENIAASAFEVRRAAAHFHQRASAPRAVAALPLALADIEKALERLAMGAVEAADTIQPGTDGLSPEARALRWQLHHLAAWLRGAAQAGADTRRSARELITQQDAAVHGDPVLV